jgi:hypothetical protein
MANTYLSRTPSIAGNQKTFTISTWVKFHQFSPEKFILTSGAYGGSRSFSLASGTNAQLDIQSNSSGVADYFIRTNRVFRDVTGWYHIVVAVDTTQATSTDRVKIYVNGVQETSFSTASYPSLNFDTGLNSTQEHQINGRPSTSDYGSVSHTHYHLIDGIAYDASTFGQTDATTGIWKPKTSPSVTYGTNGFFLKFESSGSMGLDSSGNANNFTVSGNLRQTVDTPSNVFVTFNPLDTTRTSSSTPLFQNGNTTAYNAASDGSYLASTMAVNKGKWYAEFKVGAGANTRNFGILDVTSSLAYIGHPTSGSATNSYAYNSLAGGGLLRDGNTEIASSVGTTTNGDIVSVMIDLDSATKTIKFQKNGVNLSGTTQMTISQSSDTYWIFALRADGDQYVYANFGNGYFGTTAVSSATSDESGLGIFEYTVPSGYYALCTKNINTQG